MCPFPGTRVATYGIVANASIQRLDITSLAMKSLHSTVTTLHSMARKGSITRLYDAHPVFTVVCAVTVALALALLACIVAITLTDRSNARKRNAYIQAPVSSIMGSATINMKGI